MGTQDSPRIGLKMFKSKLTVVNSDILSTLLMTISAAPTLGRGKLIKRRKFVSLGALLPITVLAGARAAVAQRAGSNAALPTAVPLRESGPVEVVFKAPHGQPNGLAQGPNPGELWV